MPLVPLLAQPGYRLSFQARPLLQGREPLCCSQLELPLRLYLIQEVEGPLAGLGIPLEQFILLLLKSGGLLRIPPRPL